MFTSQVVKNEARRLGFTLAGVTTPDPPLHMPAYENWLSLGRHGTMNYLAGERARACRRDPRLILPDCRSILVLAARYPEPETGKAGGWSGPAGRVAAYAWGRDYHLVLPQRLQALVTFIEQQVGNKVAQRWYTDSGPSWNATWPSAQAWGGSAKTPVSSTRKSAPISCWLKSCLGLPWNPIHLSRPTAAGPASVASQPVPPAASCRTGRLTPGVASPT